MSQKRHLPKINKHPDQTQGRTPTYQHNTCSNPRQSIMQATMRKHAPQAQSHITKAAMADPLKYQHRGPPEAPNTKAMRRASIRRPIRTQRKGGCTARASTHHGGKLIGQDDPHATDSAYQRDPPTSQMRLADNWSQNIKPMPKMVTRLSYL
jgi:hypothetical protein